LAKLDGELLRVGQKLSEARRGLTGKLGKAVEKHLGDLGFEQSQFEVALTSSLMEQGRREDAKGEGTKTGETKGQTASAFPSSRLPCLSSTGFDTVEFQFAPNPGEPARPLRAIASSGEMSRVMLALKTVLAAEDEVPVLIFDEIDVNIGGATAATVGEKMAQIARQRQVVCITHLPAVAAAAPAHYVVSKQVKDGRTVSEIALLEKTARVDELARMLGGQAPAARKHAQALLDL
jgi:DNA repair protein RecN (Recombination protein N)